MLKEQEETSQVVFVILFFLVVDFDDVEKQEQQPGSVVERVGGQSSRLRAPQAKEAAAQAQKQTSLEVVLG